MEHWTGFVAAGSAAKLLLILVAFVDRLLPPRNREPTCFHMTLFVVLCPMPWHAMAAEVQAQLES